MPKADGMAGQQEVRASLGCGTLILIAIIVLVFGGRNDHESLERKLDSLQSEIVQLRQEITVLNEKLSK